ncbi:MAG: hypothetical protein K1X28_00905 [Parachlamydiales bacterium]|nr:hypothetical protein [Parachlamydiales bacterium]
MKIGFRDTCPSCGIDLHTCTGCRYYSPGKPNDCLVPGTEYIRDREAPNFCEDFKGKTDFQEKKPEGKKNFDSLFKEDP